jgi:hypothetical protein
MTMRPRDAAPGQPASQVMGVGASSSQQASQVPHNALSGPTAAAAAKNRPSGKANLRKRPAPLL